MAVMIGERYRSTLAAALDAHGIEPVWLPDALHVDPRLAGHADLSAILLSGKKIVLAQHLTECEKIVNYLFNNKCSMIRAAQRLGSAYPEDARLCACIIGNRLIHNKKCTDQAVLDNFSGKIVNVRQGYSKCSVCVVDDNAIITSDSGIARAALEEGIDVLKIRPGYIVLDGFDCGFIGGASFTLKHAVCFTGTLSNHLDSAAIEAFIESKNKRPIYLTQHPIFDIGGGIVI